LSPYTRGAVDIHRELVILGGGSAEIEAQKGNGLLGIAAGVIAPQSGCSADHPEVIRERRGNSRSVREEVVDDGVSGDAGEGAIFPLEIQSGSPVVRIVLLDGRGCALALPEETRVRVDAEIGSSNNGVSVSSDFTRGDDGVNSLGSDHIVH
jgi:hypothetical protein